MDTFVIEGGTPLHGDVTVSGAKNAVLPILAACLLTDEPCEIRRVPNLRDVHSMVDLIAEMGAEAEFRDNVVRVHAAEISAYAPYELVRRMRASVCVLGPLFGRLRTARVSMPGGCVIGDRPIDLHIKGLRALGARVRIEEGYVVIDPSAPHGADIFLGGRYGSTVTGTANVLMAAVLAPGETRIVSAACEPEVEDLARFLTSMGARIEGIGTPTLTVRGVEHLHGATHTVIPDRIEAATFLMAAAITGGSVRVCDVVPGHLSAVVDKLGESGLQIDVGPDWIVLRRDAALRPIDIITLPYPGFPTDLQAQMTALMALTQGITIITEKIFPARFMHVPELNRMGARIAVEGSSAISSGVERLSGADVMASDLRASAALVVAGLAAYGTTTVHRVYHVDRGYERIEEKLRSLGGRIARVPEGAGGTTPDA